MTHRKPRPTAGVLSLALLVALTRSVADEPAPPMGPSGMEAVYHLDASARRVSNSVERLTLRLGPVETGRHGTAQWLSLQASKTDGRQFQVWILGRGYPRPSLEETAATTVRYVLQEGDAQPQEFVHRQTGAPVLPSIGGWEHLWPRPVEEGFHDGIVAPKLDWLGHRYALATQGRVGSVAAPPQPQTLQLQPEVLVGVPSNTRTQDDARRYDGSEYPMVRLTRADYAEMIAAGMNCFRVDAEQSTWLKDQPVFYWGLGGSDVAFPECFYRSTYLGAALFLDEPAVGTRDHVIRPRLAKDPASRRALTPQVAAQDFQAHFHEAVQQGPPTALTKGLRARGDLDLGTLDVRQRNLYSWETMVATAAWQLTAEHDGGPNAIVFEPPGRFGARRTLPEMNMAYGCQLLPDNPAHLADVIFGFLRGAARAADKSWGVSIYGQVDRADAPWLLTHAYDLGATRFFFWDNYQLACVPFGECLALSRHLQAHARSHPDRNLPQLKRTADVAILLPPGYNLGHVHMGRGNLWGLGELNLERTNRHGIPYRQVMANAFTEIERCLRSGVAFDLLWALDGLPLAGYREVVRVLEDGGVEVAEGSRRSRLATARLPDRAGGQPPQLHVDLTTSGDDKPRAFTAQATVTAGSAPVYYTTGAGPDGVHRNAMVLWELYGPGPEDYRMLPGRPVESAEPGASPTVVETRFTAEAPGRYRLRAATADLAGRSTVVWKTFKVDGR